MTHEALEQEKVALTLTAERMKCYYDKKVQSIVIPQVNFLWKITFDILYNNEFLIRVHSRTLSISSEHML